MVRQTSIDVFHKIKDQGLVGRMQFLVYEIIFEKGPMTGGEVVAILTGGRGITSQARSRINELVKVGLVVEVGKRKCSVTGQVALLWDVTANLPTKPPKREKEAAPTKPARKLKAVDGLPEPPAVLPGQQSLF